MSVKVLLVEDEANIRQFTKINLEEKASKYLKLKAEKRDLNLPRKIKSMWQS